MQLWLPETFDAARRRHLLFQAAAASVPVAADCPAGDIFLTDTAAGVVLAQRGRKETVRADFTAGSAARRAGAFRHELIVRAARAASGSVIWDATAGLGRDALILAAAGAQLVLFERHPAAWLLLTDALWRAQHDARTADIAARMQAYFGSITQNSLPPLPAPDSICLDPMFPARRKSALVKKEMQFFQEIIGGDSDSGALLSAARAQARSRIVVKRPAKAPFLDNRPPAFQYSGKTARFDIYLPDAA